MAKTLSNNGRDHATLTPAVGNSILLDGQHVHRRLVEDPTGWAGMRLEGTSVVLYSAVAVRVELTGRTFETLPHGVARVRVRVVFLGDGEPDTAALGWLYFLQSALVWGAA